LVLLFVLPSIRPLPYLVSFCAVRYQSFSHYINKLLWDEISHSSGDSSISQGKSISCHARIAPFLSCPMSFQSLYAFDQPSRLILDCPSWVRPCPHLRRHRAPVYECETVTESAALLQLRDISFFGILDVWNTYAAAGSFEDLIQVFFTGVGVTGVILFVGTTR
jgi:hypothetical protein